jgi:hypothetical protein
MAGLFFRFPPEACGNDDLGFPSPVDKHIFTAKFISLERADGLRWFLGIVMQGKQIPTASRPVGSVISGGDSITIPGKQMMLPVFFVHSKHELSGCGFNPGRSSRVRPEGHLFNHSETSVLVLSGATTGSSSSLGEYGGSIHLPEPVGQASLQSLQRDYYGCPLARLSPKRAHRLSLVEDPAQPL